MFICLPCHKRYYGPDSHFSGSYGPCESCSRTANCSNCNCYPLEKLKMINKARPKAGGSIDPN